MGAVYYCHTEGYDFSDFPPTSVASGTEKAAALSFARFLCSDYPDWFEHFNKGGKVWVRRAGTGETSVWLVRVEFQPQFCASPVVSPPPPRKAVP